MKNSSKIYLIVLALKLAHEQAMRIWAEDQTEEHWKRQKLIEETMKTVRSEWSDAQGAEGKTDKPGPA